MLSESQLDAAGRFCAKELDEDGVHSNYGRDRTVGVAENVLGWPLLFEENPTVDLKREGRNEIRGRR